MPPTIDLGEDYEPAVRPGRFRAPVRQRSLQWRIGVPMCAILISLAASVPAPAAPLARVATISFGDQASVAEHGDDVFILDNANDRNRLRAFAIDGGRQLWTVGVAEVASDSVLTYVAGEGGGAVMVSLDPEQSTGIHTQLFDAATGRELWRSNDGVFSVAADGDIVTRSSAQFPLASNTDSPRAPSGWTFQRRGLRSGATLWSDTVGLDCYPQLVRDPDHGMADGIVETCGSAPRLRMVDIATGAVTAQRSLPTTGAPPQAFVFGDAVVVLSAGRTVFSLDGFQGAGLAPLWSAPDSVQPWQHAIGCGVILCLNSDFGTVGVNPRTGDETEGPPSGGSGLLPSIVMLPDRAPADATYNRPQTVPDGQAVTVPAPVSGDAWVEQVAPGVLIATPLQKLPGVGVASCLRMDVYLACVTARGELSFWRLP